MEGKYILSAGRRLTEEEQKLVWKKPITHIESKAEQRICEEVKRNWTRGEMKITCFADMDKSDILGLILPVLPEEHTKSNDIVYRYYPSEIVRAYENGWLLEIQEPTVIRDAAVLMALNSALEPDGSINLPTLIQS